MNTEQERAEFEAWYRLHHGSLDVYGRDASGEYADKQVQGAFNVWQARAALAQPAAAEAAQSAPAGEREAFEAWARRPDNGVGKLDLRLCDIGLYYRRETGTAWDGFKAGAAWQRTQSAGVPEDLRAAMLAVIDRSDWRTAANRAELRALLAAALEAERVDACVALVADIRLACGDNGKRSQPEVAAYRYTASRSFGKRNQKWHYQESFPHASNREVAEIGRMEELIRLSDYEALQAECEELRKDAERYRRLHKRLGDA